MLARTWRSPSLRRALSSSAAGLTSSSCWPTDSESSTASSRSSTIGRRQLEQLRAERGAQPRTIGRRVAQRHRAPPGAAAHEPCRERELAERPSHSLRAREQPVEERPERPSQGQLVPDRLRELERLGELGGRAAAVDASLELSSLSERPRPPPFRPEPLGDGAPRQRRQLSQLSYPQPLELRVAVGAERQQRERQRCEKALLRAVRDDECLPGTRDARRRQSGEPAPGSARAWIPGRSDRGERPLERRLQASVEPLDPARLEVDATGLLGLDREPGVLEPLQRPLPLALDRGGILLDEDERRAGGERLPQAHPRLHPCRLGRGGDGSHERLRARQRRERRRLERQPRPGAKRCAQLEAGDDEAGDHRNVCSTYERMFLSRSQWLLPVPAPTRGGSGRP